MGHARPGTGRPARCQQHRRDYRAWYQRKWRHENRHGPATYNEEYVAAWLHPATAPATVAAPEAASVEHVADKLRQAMSVVMTQVRPKVAAVDHPFFDKKVRELADLSLDLDRIAGRLRGRRMNP